MPETITPPPVSNTLTEEQKNACCGIGILFLLFTGILGALLFLAPPAYDIFAKPLVFGLAVAMGACLLYFRRRKV